MRVQDVTAGFILMASGSFQGGCVWVNRWVDTFPQGTSNIYKSTVNRRYISEWDCECINLFLLIPYVSVFSDEYLLHTEPKN